MSLASIAGWNVCAGLRASWIVAFSFMAAMNPWN